MIEDIRYAIRAMRRSPGFTLLAIATMAMGIGANAAIFSIVNAVLLRPLPYPRPADLVLVSQINRQTGQSYGDATPANFLDWRRRSHAFDGLSAYVATSLILTGTGNPERVDGAMVNANFFDVLGAKPVLGRSFQPADEQRGARVAILADGLWRRRFGGRLDVVGQTLPINAEPTTIVGVMPPGIDFPDRAQAWIPPHFAVPDDPLLGSTRDPSQERTHGYIQVVGRLKRGSSLAAAQADMDGVARSLERDYPNDLPNIGIGVVSLRSELVADVKPTVALLFAAVGLLLLIANANVSGLLLARATARQQEIAVRVAIGASRGRIVAQLLTESVLLGVLGGGCGVLLGMWLVGPLVALSPTDLNVVGDIRIDRAVLLFSVLVSVGSGLLFGLAPARQLGRLDVNADLKQTARGGTNAGQRRLRGALVAGEIAISLVLLIAAGLTIRSFIRLQRVTVGFDPEHVVTSRLSPPPARYPTAGQRADLYEHTVESLRAIPGVTLAGATSRLPLQSGNSARGLTIPGVPPDVNTGADYRTASPDYFRTMRIPVLRGRAFTDADREGRPLVAIISASLAERFWPGRDPVGAHFSIGDPPITIVGVVGDVHSAALDAPVRPTVYVPYRQDAFPFMTFVVRTSGGPEAAEAGIRQAVWQIDRELPVDRVRTMDGELSNSLSRQRFGVTLLTAFGVAAVALAAIGLYGVLAFIVAQRTREIGVRMALGATSGDVVRDVVGQGLRLACIGVGVGLALAAASTRIISSLLYGTSPTDVLTFAAVSLLLVVIAGAASLVPALRASRVAPLAALREN